MKKVFGLMECWINGLLDRWNFTSLHSINPTFRSRGLSSRLALQCAAVLVAMMLITGVAHSRQAQVETFFHNAANFYINGKYADAVREIEAGLEAHPNDEKLQKLLEKILEEQQQQQEQQQESQDQQEQEQEQEEQEEQEQQEQPEQQEGQQDQQQPEEEQQQEQQAANPEEISKEEAERLLNALQGQEQDLQKKRKKKGKGRPRSAKDW